MNKFWFIAIGTTKPQYNKKLKTSPISNPGFPSISSIKANIKFVTKEVGIINIDSLIIFFFGISGLPINLSQAFPNKVGQYQKNTIT